MAQEDRGGERGGVGEVPREDRFCWGGEEELTYYDEKGNKVSRGEWEAGVGRKAREKAEEREARGEDGPKAS